MSVVDRSEVSRALAKAIAFKDCGKDAQASAWARKLVEALRCADILGVPGGVPGEVAAGVVPAEAPVRTGAGGRLRPAVQPPLRRRVRTGL